MKRFLQLLGEEMSAAFAAAGYEAALGRVTVSDRPDLCEYQCNGAMAGAKLYHKAPMLIAADVSARLADSAVFESVQAVAPGFLNLRVRGTFAAGYVNEMAGAPHFGLEPPAAPRTVVVDYGGANVAKPLHVGHLRPAIIGESIKRICRYVGDSVIGDVHLGDWGLQMGLIICELALRQPDLPYFDAAFTGPYPAQPPFTLQDLEEIYPTASARSKQDEAFRLAAQEATLQMQQGRAGYRALWRHIMDVSLADLRRVYDALNVHFDWWKGESDVNDLIPDMVRRLKEMGLAHPSNGALVVDVTQAGDARELPPCIILKSDGAALYATTDLATICDRMQTVCPDEMIYVADNRQRLHLTQVFRTARMAGFVKPDTVLRHVAFGTMNGADGKPFKTRDGGVMRLEELVKDINDEMLRKTLASSRDIGEEEARDIARTVGLAALKYGDLSNQAGKDYVFDIDRFTSFEGDTGPYILYTIIRIKSILSRCDEAPQPQGVLPPVGTADRALLLQLTGFSAMMCAAREEVAPHKVCAYLYDLANDFNRFYHETRILAEPDEARRAGWLALCQVTRRVLETCIDVLGFDAPERM